MIVDHDDSGRRLGNGAPEYFTRMHERAVQQPPGDQHLAEDLTLAVQRKEVKLLHLEIPQPSTKQAHDIFGVPDARTRRPLLPRDSGTQLEGRNQPPRLGWADAPGPKQLGA